ncbi:hypothetical protein DSBG_3906 [Desulfosporosinus sp. BG]|nr:hypothetical protein DSBG_3906 [Desulfosporosinus sp. BG]
MQMEMVKESKKYKDTAVRENNGRAFEELREYMAQLQSIILTHWSHDVLFKRPIIPNPLVG